MRQPWDWTEEDLLALVANGVTENIDLEYKECEALGPYDAKKNEISKDVSAFANSAGGTIVYGMVENGHVPTRLDSGYDPSTMTKEWIEQVVNSRIQRRIDGIRIKPVDLVTTNPGKVAYVVHVPQSMRAPHQAWDKKFYKRFNFAAVPMEEYEIRDVSRRAEAPDLCLSYQIVPEPNQAQRDPEANPSGGRYKVIPIITNESPTPAEYSVIRFFIDKRLTVADLPRNVQSRGDDLITCKGAFVKCQIYTVNHCIPHQMPVFHGVQFQLLDPPLLIEAPSPGTYVLGYKITAPRMPEKRGAVPVVFPSKTTTIVFQNGNSAPGNPR